MRRAFVAVALAVVLPLPGRADVTVKSGETLSEIADRHGVSLNRLMQANGIRDPGLLQVGQRLVIPGQGSAARRNSGGATVVVQPGETLSEIAERNGTTAERLMHLNGISNPALLEAGRTLLVSGRGGAGAPTRGEGAGSGGGSSYTVRSGETLGEIAERNGTTVERLMQLNGIGDADTLQAGRRLLVPRTGGGGGKPPAAAQPVSMWCSLERASRRSRMPTSCLSRNWQR